MSAYIFISSAAHPPFTPVNVTTIVTPTTAIITLIVSPIACMPEEQYIQYIGLELQNEQKISSAIVGPSNLSTINVEYSITLGGLEEDNTYNFSVVSVNCIGSVTTSTMKSQHYLHVRSFLVIVISSICLIINYYDSCMYAKTCCGPL